MYEPELIQISSEDAKTVLETLAHLSSSIRFFYDIVKSGEIQETEVRTHMSLYESYFKELSALLHYDSVVAAESAARYETIRRLNEENRALTEKAGKELTPEAASGALRLYHDAFITWYEACGFKYASQQSISPYGTMHYEFSSDLVIEPVTHLSSDESLFARLAATRTPVYSDESWDVVRDKYSGQLLDTDNNRARFTELFREAFPTSRIIGYESRCNDYNSMSLRPKVIVTFKDCATLEQRLLP